MSNTDKCVHSEKNDVRERTYHRLRHSFKTEVIVPIAAITNNVDFVLYDCEKMMLTTDNIECVVEFYELTHMCKLESDVKRLYGMDMWPFIMRWYGVSPNMSSMEFVKLKLKKYEKV